MSRLSTQTSLLALILFAFYAYHCAPGVTVEDSGDFIMSALTLGTAHPPGYPLYSMLGFVASRLPFIPPAMAVNLVSGLFAALSAALLFWLLVKALGLPRIVAAVSAGALALHPMAWSQAVVAEVYSLTLFLIVSALCLAHKHQTTAKPTFWYLQWFIVGLGLTNHYPLFVLGLLGFLAWPFTSLPEKKPRTLLLALFALGLGLSPYLLVVINTFWRAPSYSFGKLSDAGMIWEHFMRIHYRGVEQGASIADRLFMFWSAESTLVLGFAAFSPLLLIGVWRLLRDGHRWSLPILISAASTTLGLALLAGMPTSKYALTAFHTFVVPGVFFHAVILAAGAAWALQKASGRSRQIFVALLVAGLGLQFAYARPKASHRGDTFAADWGRALLNSLAPDSTLILCGNDIFALYYLHFIEKVRPDLTLYDRSGVFSEKNLYGPGLLYQAPNPFERREKAERHLISTSTKPVYFDCDKGHKELKIPVFQTMYAYRVTNAGHRQEAKPQVLDQALLELAVSGNPRDEYWLDERRIYVLHHALGYAAQSEPGLIGRITEAIARSKYFRDPDFSLALAKILVDNQRYMESLDWFTKREQLVQSKNLHPEELSAYCGIVLMQGDLSRAEELCLMATEKTCIAAAHLNLALIYRNRGQAELVVQQAQAALRCDPNNQTAQRLLK